MGDDVDGTIKPNSTNTLKLIIIYTASTIIFRCECKNHVAKDCTITKDKTYNKERKDISRKCAKHIWSDEENQVRTTIINTLKQ